MGSLEIFLDKGEEWDWFGSRWIRFYAITFGISFLILIVWELRARKPLMELRLFSHKNFAVCCFLMLLTGGILNASTVLQPQFTQQNLGYTATIAGLALSGGGIVLLFMMPLAGQAVSRFPARNIIQFGFGLFTFGFIYSAMHLNLGISFGFTSWLRILQVLPIPFVFISVTTAAYFNLPSELNNQVAGIINFARNIGGSILISLTNAFVTESAQFHQSNLLKHLAESGRNFEQAVAQYTGALTSSMGPANAQLGAQTQIYSAMGRQTQALAYVDIYYILGAVSAVMILLSFLLDKNNPRAGAKTEIAVH
jgi:DHA2 family multidrug resistance protein